MHVHLPKPLHGWREFIGEVGIIVVGVLIALGAESLVEDFRWHHQVSISEDALKNELGPIAGRSYERLILQPCLTGRLAQLGAALRGTHGKWQGLPMVVHGNSHSVFMSPYRVPNRPLIIDAWQNALTTGTVNHMQSGRVFLMARTYSQARQFYELQEEEARSAARITPLAYDADLSEDMRVNMLSAVADIDRINSLMALTAQQMIDKIRSLHLFTGAEVEKWRRQALAENRAEFGTCVQDVPLSL